MRSHPAKHGADLCPSLQERHRDSKKLFKGALGFPNLLHELRLNELRHFPCHFHQLSQNHGLEAISGIYPDILIPHFLALGRISTHTTHSHESNHITRRHSDTLVDSLINTIVWFRDKLHLILMTCDSRTDSYSR